MPTPGMASRKATVAALEALDALASGTPLRHAVSAALRAQPALGPKERRFAAHSTREVAQHLRRLDALLAQAGAEPRKLIPEDRSLLRLLALRLRVHEAPVNQVLRELALPGPRRPRSVGDELLAELAGRMPAALSLPADRTAALALQYSFPDWLLARLLESVPKGEEEAFLEACARAPGLDLRVNLARATPESVLAELKAAGLEASPGRYLPEAIQCEDRAMVFDLPGFKQGRFEVQDEASQLIARLAAARPGQKVLDACAGAGGKTLALAGLEPAAQLFATDADRSRLMPLRNRARRAGAKIQVVDAVPNTWFDVVLVDAPCSGLGALAREPDAKWRLDSAALDRYPRVQLEILQRLAPRVRPGGRLVYATCSPLRAEDEGVVEAFLAGEKSFALARPALALGPELAARLGGGPTLRLWAHRHGTGSFFAALLERKS